MDDFVEDSESFDKVMCLSMTSLGTKFEPTIREMEPTQQLMAESNLVIGGQWVWESHPIALASI